MQRFTAHVPLLKTTSAFGIGRRRWSSPQQCYLHCLRAIAITSKQLNKIIRSMCRVIIERNLSVDSRHIVLLTWLVEMLTIS